MERGRADIFFGALLWALFSTAYIQSSSGLGQNIAIPNPDTMIIVLINEDSVDPAWFEGYLFYNRVPGVYLEYHRNIDYPGGWPAPGCVSFVDVVMVKFVPSWNTRKLTFLAGTADLVEVLPQNYGELDDEPGVRYLTDESGTRHYERTWVQRQNYTGYFFYYMWKGLDADINGDGTVSIPDAAPLNAYWWDGTFSGHMGYNPVADIWPHGGDGFVNLFDAGLVNAQWHDQAV